MSPLIKRTLVVTFIALLLRGTMFVAVASHPERLFHPDTSSYLQPALNLLAGHGFSQRQVPPFIPDVARTPVYPLFIALLYRIFGPHPVLVAGVQVLLSALAVGFTYLLGTQLLPEPQARTGGLFLALSLGSIVYALYILTETLFTLLLLGLIWTLVAYKAKAQRRWLIGGGLLAGLATLCRPIASPYLLVVTPLVGHASRGRWQQKVVAALIFLATTALIVVPWSFRNYRLIGSPTLSTITDYNLLFYNAVSLEADIRGVGQAQMRAEMDEQVREELARRGKVDNEAAQVSLYDEWGRRIILAHPWRYLYIHLKNDLNSLLPNVTEFLELLGMTQGGRNTISVLNQYGLWAAVRHYLGTQMWLLWPVLPFMGLLGLTYLGSLAGLIILLRRRAWFPLALLLTPTAYFLLVSGAASHPRFRVPVEPYICLLAGAGLAHVWQWVCQRPGRSADK